VRGVRASKWRGLARACCNVQHVGVGPERGRRGLCRQRILAEDGALAVLYSGGTMTNSRFVLVGFGVVATSLLASCSTCGSIQASDYDQSCSTASDCVVVAEGDSCNGLFCVDCGNAAINVSAQAQYEANLNSIGGQTGICPCPADRTATCDAGVYGL